MLCPKTPIKYNSNFTTKLQFINGYQIRQIKCTENLNTSLQNRQCFERS